MADEQVIINEPTAKRIASAVTGWERFTKGGHNNLQLKTNAPILGFFAEIDSSDGNGNYGWTQLEPNDDGTFTENTGMRHAGHNDAHHARHVNELPCVPVGERVWLMPSITQPYFVFEWWGPVALRTTSAWDNCGMATGILLNDDGCSTENNSYTYNLIDRIGLIKAFWTQDSIPEGICCLAVPIGSNGSSGQDDPSGSESEDLPEKILNFVPISFGLCCCQNSSSPSSSNPSSGNPSSSAPPSSGSENPPSSEPSQPPSENPSGNPSGNPSEGSVDCLCIPPPPIDSGSSGYSGSGGVSFAAMGVSGYSGYAQKTLHWEKQPNGKYALMYGVE